MAYFPVSLCKRTTISRILSNDFVNINQHRLWRLFEQQADPTDDLGGTCRVCDDSRRSFACFLRLGGLRLSQFKQVVASVTAAARG